MGFISTVRVESCSGRYYFIVIQKEKPVWADIQLGSDDVYIDYIFLELQFKYV